MKSAEPWRSEGDAGERPRVPPVATRTWHVTAQVTFPNQLGGTPPPGGGLPTQLSPKSRVPTGRWQIGDADVFIYEADKSSLPQIRDDLRYGLGEIAARRDSAAPDPLAAAQEAVPILDRVLESMSFQMQAALQVQAVRAIDLTGTPSVGEEREFGQWSGLALPTFRPTSVPMGSLIGRLIPEPGLDLDPADTRANRALDRYLKALAAQSKRTTSSSSGSRARFSPPTATLRSKRLTRGGAVTSSSDAPTVAAPPHGRCKARA